MINFLKRVQRDRDEQLSHRQQDSKILIQRNKNMLRDMSKRHQTEYKKTLEFLKYALGNRAPRPAKNLMLADNSSLLKSQSSIAGSKLTKRTMVRDMSSDRFPTIGTNAKTSLQNNSLMKGRHNSLHGSKAKQEKGKFTQMGGSQSAMHNNSRV